MFAPWMVVVELLMIADRGYCYILPTNRRMKQTLYESTQMGSKNLHYFFWAVTSAKEVQEYRWAQADVQELFSKVCSSVKKTFTNNNSICMQQGYQSGEVPFGPVVKEPALNREGRDQIRCLQQVATDPLL